MRHDEARETMSSALFEDADPGVADELRAHIAECDECRAEWVAYQQTADALGRAVPQVAPPPALRSRVLAAAVDGRRSTGPLGGDADVIRRTAADRASTRERPLAPARPRSLAPWLALAATVVLAAAAALLLTTRGALDELRDQLAATEQRLDDTERRMRQAQADAAERARVERVLAAADLRVVPLDALAPAPGARARAFVSPSEGLVLTAEGLPRPPGDQVYQLWTIDGGAPQSAGIFSLDDNGRGRLISELSPTQRTPALLAVTVEPAGGVVAPTGAMFLRGAAF